MREILFKAKRINNGEWVEGWIVPTMQNTYHYGYRIIETCGINYDELDFWEPSFISWEVDENTICQYTGLTDKNGNKIWENDIIQLEDRICHIYWFDKNAQFDCKFIKHNKDIVITNFKGVEPREYEDYEVIGNIFDNPELLKGVRNE